VHFYGFLSFVCIFFGCIYSIQKILKVEKMICQEERTVPILKAMQGLSLGSVVDKCRKISINTDKTCTSFQASYISLPVCDRGNQDLERHGENNFKAFISSADVSCF